MGTKVAQKEKKLNVIKSAAAASVNVPALRQTVSDLIDEVQRLKSILVAAGIVSSD